MIQLSLPLRRFLQINSLRSPTPVLPVLIPACSLLRVIVVSGLASISLKQSLHQLNYLISHFFLINIVTLTLWNYIWWLFWIPSFLESFHPSTRWLFVSFVGIHYSIALQQCIINFCTLHSFDVFFAGKVVISHEFSAYWYESFVVWKWSTNLVEFFLAQQGSISARCI